MANTNNGNSDNPAIPPGRDEDAAVEEYGRRYRAWQAAAQKVLTARDLMEMAGGYDEAFVLLDAVIYTEADGSDEICRPAGIRNERTGGDYGQRMRQCEATTRQVLAARRLFDLAGGDQQEAFMVLDAVLVATGGDQAHQQAGERHTLSAQHHEGLAMQEG